MHTQRTYLYSLLIFIHASVLYNQTQEADRVSWRFLLYAVSSQFLFYFMKIFKIVFLNYQRQQQWKQKRKSWGYLTEPNTYTRKEREFKIYVM